MNFSPEQIAQLVNTDPDLSAQERALILSQLQEASMGGLSALSPGRLYSVGLGALAGWIVGKLVTGSPMGGYLGGAIGGLMGLNQPDGRPPGLSMDHGYPL